MKKCPKCNNTMSDSSAFCDKCGTSLDGVKTEEDILETISTIPTVPEKKPKKKKTKKQVATEEMDIAPVAAPKSIPKVIEEKEDNPDYEIKDFFKDVSDGEEILSEEEDVEIPIEEMEEEKNEEPTLEKDEEQEEVEENKEEESTEELEETHEEESVEEDKEEPSEEEQEEKEESEIVEDEEPSDEELEENEEEKEEAHEEESVEAKKEESSEEEHEEEQETEAFEEESPEEVPEEKEEESSEKEQAEEKEESEIIEEDPEENDEEPSEKEQAEEKEEPEIIEEKSTEEDNKIEEVSEEEETEKEEQVEEQEEESEMVEEDTSEEEETLEDKKEESEEVVEEDKEDSEEQKEENKEDSLEKEDKEEKDEDKIDSTIVIDEEPEEKKEKKGKKKEESEETEEVEELTVTSEEEENKEEPEEILEEEKPEKKETKKTSKKKKKAKEKISEEEIKAAEDKILDAINSVNDDIVIEEEKQEESSADKIVSTIVIEEEKKAEETEKKEEEKPEEKVEEKPEEKVEEKSEEKVEEKSAEPELIAGSEVEVEEPKKEEETTPKTEPPTTAPPVTAAPIMVNTAATTTPPQPEVVPETEPVQQTVPPTPAPVTTPFSTQQIPVQQPYTNPVQHTDVDQHKNSIQKFFENMRPYEVRDEDKDIKTNVSLVLGAISLVLCGMLPISLSGLLMAILSKERNQLRKLGIILNSIAVGIGVIALIVFIVYVSPKENVDEYSTFKGEGFALAYDENWKLIETEDGVRALQYNGEQAYFSQLGASSLTDVGIKCDFSSSDCREGVYNGFYDEFDKQKKDVAYIIRDSSFMLLKDDIYYATFNYAVKSTGELRGKYYILISVSKNSALSFVSDVEPDKLAIFNPEAIKLLESIELDDKSGNAGSLQILDEDSAWIQYAGLRTDAKGIKNSLYGEYRSLEKEPCYWVIGSNNTFYWYSSEDDRSDNYYYGSFNVKTGKDAMKLLGLKEKYLNNLLDKSDGKFLASDVYGIVFYPKKWVQNGESKDITIGTEMKHIWIIVNHGTEGIEAQATQFNKDGKLEDDVSMYMVKIKD